MRHLLRQAALRTVVPRRQTPQDGTVALTFDDGPDEHFTPLVLDVLAARGAPATFFLVGQRAERHPDIVRRMVRDGHAVASHTWSHPEVFELSARALFRECQRGRAAVERSAGRPAWAYRPPKGHWTATEALVARVTRLVPWLWTLDPSDWRGDATTDGIVEQLQRVAAHDVVLLHDAIAAPQSPEAHDRSATVAALPRLLDLVAARGLRPVTLDDA